MPSCEPAWIHPVSVDLHITCAGVHHVSEKYSGLKGAIVQLQVTEAGHASGLNRKTLVQARRSITGSTTC